MELRRRNKPTLASAVQESLEAVKEFDIYPKLKEDHRTTEKTVAGAAGARRAAVALVCVCSTLRHCVCMCVVLV